MILQKGDKRREDFLKKGNLLWRLRNNGGGANGLMAGGMVFLIFAVLIAVPLIAADFARGGIVFGLVFGIPGILLVGLGAAFQKKKMKNCMKYYQEATGFSLEELKKLEQELMEPDMLMVGNVPEKAGVAGASEKKPQIACMISKHYFFMPTNMGESYIRRLSDMVLAVYSERIPGMGGCKRGLVFLSERDDKAYYNALLTVEVCEEIIQELRERTPGLITEHFIMDGDRKYDVITDSGEIARICKERREKAKKNLNTVEYFDKK